MYSVTVVMLNMLSKLNSVQTTNLLLRLTQMTLNRYYLYGHPR